MSESIGPGRRGSQSHPHSRSHDQAVPPGTLPGGSARRAEHFDPDETAYLPVIDSAIAQFVPPAPVVRYDSASRTYPPLHSAPHPSVAERPGAEEGLSAAERPESLDEEIDKADRKNLGRNSVLMASGTLASRVLGMINASLQTAVLGTLVVGDAFKAANTLPNFILVLLSGGILNAILIPQIAKAMRRPDGGQDYVDRLVTASLALIAGVAVLATAGAPLLMRASTSLSGPGLRLTIAFAYLCLPQVLFYGIFAVLGNILNARGSFGAYGWAPVANNVVAIAGEVVFLRMWGRQDDPSAWTPQMVWVLAGTATLGILVQTLVLVPFLWRTGFRWRLRVGLRGHGFGQLGRFAGLTFLALVIAQGGGLLIMKVATYLVNTASARGIHVASYISYQNALSLFQMPYSLIAFSLLTALFPQLARAWQRRADSPVDAADLRALLYRCLTLPALGIIPASAMLIALSSPAVRVIFVSLNADEAAATAPLLMLMCAAMMAYTIVTVQQQYCFASEQGRTNLWMQCLLTGIQMAFTLLAYAVPLKYGMLVVCAGMLAGNVVLAVVFVVYADRQVGGFGLGEMLRLYVRLGLAALAGGLAAWGTSLLVLSAGSTWLWQAAALVLGAVVFLGVFAVVVRIMHIAEYADLLNPVLRRLRLPQL